MDRTEKDIDLIIEKLRVIWKKYPQLRLGQLLANVVDVAHLYYLKDDDLLKLLGTCYKVDLTNITVNDKLSEELSMTNKGKVFMHKEETVILVPRSEVEKLKADGFSLGMKDK